MEQITFEGRTFDKMEVVCEWDPWDLYTETWTLVTYDDPPRKSTKEIQREIREHTKAIEQLTQQLAA